MKTKIKLPKLHLVCANDQLRPVISHILITKEEVVATDANILVVRRTSELFSEEFIAAMPARILVHKDQWKAFYNGSSDITIEGDIIWVHYEEHKVSHSVKIEGEGLTYPNYAAIFPVEEDTVEPSEIGFNPFLLKTLAEAMLSPSQTNKGFSFKFYGEDKAIVVRPIDIDNNSKGIIMPITLSLM